MPFTELDRVDLVRHDAEPTQPTEVLRHYTQSEAVRHVQDLADNARREGPSLAQRALAQVRAVVDPHARAARALARDPNYRPVRGFTTAQAEAAGLLPPLEARISELDRLLAAAPVEGLLPPTEPRSLPSLGDGWVTASTALPALPPRA